ncbi:MAG TPA: anti-sigma factor [Candidatus Binatia bacterium]|jgi:anti-sigma-K factor RskA
MRDDPMIGLQDRELDDAGLEALAEAHAAVPPPRLRRRLLESAGRDRAEAETRRAGRALVRWRAVGAVAAGAALALLGWAVRQGETLDLRTAQLAALASANGELTARLDEQGRTLAGLRESVAAQAQVLRVLAGPRTVTAALGPKEGVSASGRVVLDAATGEGAIVVSGLEPLGGGQIYELWAIRGDRPPEPAGLFASSDARALVGSVAPVDRLAEVTAFAVSIEPAAGSRQPTGRIVLVGAVAG